MGKGLESAQAKPQIPLHLFSPKYSPYHLFWIILQDPPLVMTSSFLVPIALLSSKPPMSGLSSFFSCYLADCSLLLAPNVSLSQDAVSCYRLSGKPLLALSFKCLSFSVLVPTSLSNSTLRFPQMKTLIPFIRHVLYADSFAKHIQCLI